MRVEGSLIVSLEMQIASLKGLKDHIWAQSSSMWSMKPKDKMASDLQSMSSITDVQLQYPPPHGSDSFFCPTSNKDRTGGTDNFIMKSPTPALSLVSSQSDGASSCHSSRKSNLLDHRASLGSNNMNPFLGSQSVNHETWVWCHDRPTINLSQLSSELESVERQQDIFHNKCAEWCLY